MNLKRMKQSVGFTMNSRINLETVPSVLRRKKMVKNHRYSFAAYNEFDDLLNETLSKLNKESNLPISKTDLIIIATRRVCMEIRSGDLQASTIIINHNKN